MRGLENGLSQAERWLERDPKSIEAREALIERLLQRARVLGKVSDLDRVVALGDEVVALAPKRGKAYLIRARVRSAVHRFTDALADLDKAEALGVHQDDTRSQRGTIAMGLGRYEEALRLLKIQREKFEGSGSMLLEAVALGRHGRFKEADALFDEGLARTRAPSAFTRALFRFEQAAMWHRAGDEGRAKKGYQRVLAILPGHAHAAAHLAPSLPPKEAEALLERVTQIADDPELFALLADVRERIEPTRGKAAQERAAKGYAALIEKAPLAFADHAGWFYLAEGQIGRAVELAEMNLAARAVPEAYQLAIAALLRAGERDEACRAASRSASLPFRGPALLKLAADAFTACGQPGRAAKLRPHP